MAKFCNSLTRYSRRDTSPVRVRDILIGGNAPVRVQSMTNTDTNDTAASVAQTMRIAAAGGELVRLTAQGVREAANLAEIRAELRRQGCEVPLVADIHFLPAAAMVAAENVEKVRINPGNFNERDGEFAELLGICRRNSAALRIGVNHGSLSPAVVERYGDTPEGMVASAMEFLRRCRDEDFHDVVVSMKSSNVRVMVHAYRMLVGAMSAEGMRYPLHLGVTEAGNDMEGRIKSAVGIGALLADGIGDTIRVSLTEAPENEIPVARMLAGFFEGREKHPEIPSAPGEFYSPVSYRRRESNEIAGAGGGKPVLIGSELSVLPEDMLWNTDASASIDTIPAGKVVILSTDNMNAPAAMRSFFLRMEEAGRREPVIIKRRYPAMNAEELGLRAAADTGMLFLDGFGDGLWIECDGKSIEDADAISLAVLQAARVRISAPEYIACPGCGRTLYNLEKTLRDIKERTGDMVGVKIGVMGCIVNGPGEMADADYGYVGSGPGKITLYRGREVVKRNIPEADAIDELINLINGGK